MPKVNDAPIAATFILTLLCCGPVHANDHLISTDLFDAVEAGHISVRFIPLSAATANVLIENKTDRMLQIELPDAIAAVPVLAQFGDAGQNGGGQNGGASQGVGGGLQAGNGMQGQGFGNGQGLGNAMGNGGGNRLGGNGGQANGFGMGMMRIAPEKTRKLKASTVCLEHGKPNPNPRIAYRMIPIEEFTDDLRVAELCRRLGRGEVAQKTAQAAAWHLANGLSWVKLAKINRMESRYLGNIRFFKPTDLERAQEFVDSFSETDDATTTTDDYASKR